MKSIAFIPARGGSKRFPKKNIALLNGKPLVAWTIETALESEVFDKVVLSSDDPYVLEVAKQYSNSKLVTHKRSENLSGDTVTAAHVFGELLRDLEEQGEQYEQCCLLLPTCPFRSVEDIQRAKEGLTIDVDSIISMKPSPVVPDFIFGEGKGNKAKAFVENSSVLQGKTRRQDYPNLFYPNGAIYYAWTGKFLESNRFYSSNFKILEMPEFRSVDIDIEEDLIYAHAIYERFLK